MLRAQSESSGAVLDRIIAVVDDEVILESELRSQYDYYIKNGQKDDGTLRCTVLEGILTNRLLLSKARIDSLQVSDDRVDEELNRRLSTIMMQLGSREAMEKIYGKTFLEIKRELKPQIEEQMLIDEQRQKIMSNAKVTPRDVKDFFQSIPKDSLPYFPAEVEISQIVILPTPSAESKKAARQKLESIAEEVRSGKDFATLAKMHSMDPGSARQGGSLGEFGRGMMVPEFEEVVFSLEDGQLSNVFESPFGFHLVKLISRKGDRVQASHILIRPTIEKADEEKARKQLSEIRELILRDSLTFEAAARKYSQDPQSKNNGGRLTTSQNDFRVPLDQLDADLYFNVDQLKEGEISQPLEFINKGTAELVKAYRIVLLTKRIPPHRANLRDDYNKFQAAALQGKQAEELNKWFEKTRKQVYIDIKPGDCTQALQHWN